MKVTQFLTIEQFTDPSPVTLSSRSSRALELALVPKAMVRLLIQAMEIASLLLPLQNLTPKCSMERPDRNHPGERVISVTVFDGADT
jgi:hypothetical protein